MVSCFITPPTKKTNDRNPKKKERRRGRSFRSLHAPVDLLALLVLCRVVRNELHTCGVSQRGEGLLEVVVGRRDVYDALGKLTYGTDARAQNGDDRFKGVRSFSVGLKSQGAPGGAGVRVATEHNADAVKLLTAYGRRVLPQGAQFTSIQVSVAGGGSTSDALYPVHHDSNNIGTSHVVILSKHRGYAGGLWCDGAPVLARNTPHSFDGARPHATMPFVLGKDDSARYSLVYFTRREAPAAPAQVRAALESYGFVLPPVGVNGSAITADEKTRRKRAEEFREKAFAAFNAEWAAMDHECRWSKRAALVQAAPVDKRAAEGPASGKGAKRARN